MRDKESLLLHTEDLKCAFNQTPLKHEEHYIRFSSQNSPLSTTEKNDALHQLEKEIAPYIFGETRVPANLTDNPVPLRVIAEVIKASLVQWRMTEKNIQPTLTTLKKLETICYVYKKKLEQGCSVFL